MPRADHGRLLWGPLKDTKTEAQPHRNLQYENRTTASIVRHSHLSTLATTHL